jgi:hypothetical protein
MRNLRQGTVKVSLRGVGLRAMRRWKITVTTKKRLKKTIWRARPTTIRLEPRFILSMVLALVSTEPPWELH